MTSRLSIRVTIELALEGHMIDPVTPRFKSNYLWTLEIMSKGVSVFYGQWVLFEKVSGWSVLLEV